MKGPLLFLLLCAASAMGQATGSIFFQTSYAAAPVVGGDGVIFTGIQDPSSAFTGLCYPIANNATCQIPLKSTTVNSLLVLQCSTIITANSVCTPTNGQGCTTWTRVSAADLHNATTTQNIYSYYCTQAKAAQTSVNITLTGASGTGNWMEGWVWEASYTGTGTVALDNYCKQNAGTASPVAFCTLGTLAGTSDAMFEYVSNATGSYGLTGSSAQTSPWGLIRMFPQNGSGGDSAIASSWKYNSGDKTPAYVSTYPSPAASDSVGLAFSGGGVPVPTVAASADYLTPVNNGVYGTVGSGTTYAYQTSGTTNTLTWAESAAGSTLNTCYNASATCTPSGTTNPQTVSAAGYYCASAQKSGIATSAVACVNATVTPVIVAQHNECNTLNQGTGATLCTITPLAAGDTLIAACTDPDNKALTGMKAGATSFTGPVTGFAGADSWGTFLYYLPNVSAGAKAITVTMSYGLLLNCVLLDVTGMPSAATIDRTAVLAQSGSNLGQATGSITTTHAHDLIVGVATATSENYTPGTGYALAQSNGIEHTLALEWQVVTATGTYNPGLSWTRAVYNSLGTIAFNTN